MVNNTNSPLLSLALTSGNGIFAFDGDGPFDFDPSNNYAGPISRFTIINDNNGIVNFINGGIAPGGSTYFALESAVTATTRVVNGSSGSVASVPEPFTIIGSAIGGIAAFRLRKQLKSTRKSGG